MLGNKTQAFIEWKTLLGSEWAVEVDDHTSDCVSVGCITPANQKEVCEALNIAQKHNMSLYPISTGKNWGYGGSASSKGESVILDLSRLKRVVSFDSQLGLVRVEPGVTMGQLRDFLFENKAPFVSPYTGAGPTTSLVGNLLEKGRSSAPYVDRFSSLVSLKVLLADGSIYESPSSFFKWGVGPYVDGLFVQSNLGIVLEATLLLSPKSTETMGFYVSIKPDVPLGVIIDLVRECQQRLGSVFVSVSIQNIERANTRSEVLHANQYVHNEWLLLGTLGGEPLVVRAAGNFFKKSFKRVADRQFLFTRIKLDFIRAVGRLPFLSARPYLFQRLEPVFRSIIYGAEGQGDGGLGFLSHNNTNYAGLLFVPIIVPTSGDVVSRFAAEANVICDKYEIPFPVSFLSFTPTSLLFSLLIVFDPKLVHEKEKAHQCYAELVELAEKNGCLLYRASTSAMSTVRNNHKNFWEVAKKIKTAFDPQDIISPGRYLPPIN